MSCINLRKRFPQYRITYDPACEDHKDPWMQQIPGQFGIIYPWSKTDLAVEVDRHPAAQRQLEALPLLEHIQYGDTEHTFVFPVRLFETVADIVRSRKKRVLSEAHKERLRALAKARGTKPPPKVHRKGQKRPAKASGASR